MRLTTRRSFAAVAVALGLVAAPAGAVVPLPATPTDYTPLANRNGTFPAVDYGKRADGKDDRHAKTTWRIVEGTGNCCETLLTTTPSGRLLDFGGSLIKYSDDRGASWQKVEPVAPLVNGEGAIVAAPGGDVLGVEWDPYSGDHLQFYKYEADTGSWRYTEMPVHQPFYDREWIAVIPGPVTVGGTTHEYVSLVKGGVPKEAWFYSTDGLTYTAITSKDLEKLVEGRETVGPLPARPDANNDWTQANTNGEMTGFAGGLLADADFFTGWSLLDDGFKWSSFQFPNEQDPQDPQDPAGRFQVDSAGRLHNVVPASDGYSLDYRMSTDGGATWTSVTLPLPKYHLIEEWDFRANRAAGVAAVAVRALDQAAEPSADQDFVFKLDIGGPAPQMLRRHEIGLGDADATGGVGNTVRFDFGSVAVFPDGRVAVSFLDSTTQFSGLRGQSTSPAIAIEGKTHVGPKLNPPPEVAPVLGEVIASYSFEDEEHGWEDDVPWARESPGVSDGEDDASRRSFGITGARYVDNLDRLAPALTSPEIETAPGQTVVEFWSWQHLEEGFDRVYVEWSRNGTSWLPLTQLGSDEKSWTRSTVGFESPGGPVRIRFRFSSDMFCSAVPSALCAGTWEGVRVDEVVVGRQAG